MSTASNSPAWSSASRSRAFTIVELIVVIGIIAVLASIFVAGVSKVRAAALAVKCQSNIHTLMGGFLAFAADHDGCLPGADRGLAGGTPQVWQTDWLMNPQGYQYCPQTGTVYPYINDPSVYLCPALDTERGSTSDGNDQYASNGKFDYGFFTIFNGSPIRMVPRNSQLTLLTGGYGWYPTPIICQEDGYQMNGLDQEGNHSNVDQMTHIHNGGSYYAGIDGGVYFVIEPDNEAYWGNGCWQWSAMGPCSHSMVNLGTAYGSWGTWCGM